ncbi:LysR substrate-binding domain-containing protein [Fulvimonas soli]|jgi:DNA-binding transcriptional LysR family regulator|uniref:DNA-binding transcriptional LysR family regulator n=1 Tax=Fulvimonas soli TaxID=155197 RepID=A0A316HVC2_9GAMM|nr:LysR substrate-binding domain-containing protein [Fulvimonas soli]PWK84364.1 DNA-binding transcriptional LysR family regulator [Fulvimonas soli]TNY25429.1 LysR family transcriptional regulator [Fulvimonas soli]
MLNISPRQLDVFVQTALLGSVRAAAERVHLTQPAASMALAELERQLGAPLFDRARGRLRLNARGRELLPRAQELLERHAEFGRLGTARAEALGGELRLGASNTVGNYRVGELLGGFVRAHPHVSVRLRVANTAEIAAAMLDHALELGCVEGPVAHPALEVRPWRDDALVVCAPPDHPLVRRRGLKPADFAGARWVLREPGSATRSLSERALSGLPPGETVLELDQAEAIKQAVIAGLGIACLPAVAVTDAAAAGRLKVLRTPFLDLRRRLSLLLHRGKYRGAVLEAFLRTL